MLTPPAMGVSRAREGQAPALSALAYLERTNPDLAGAITWGTAELDPTRHVVVEAVGRSYGTGNRFSAYTAVPTIFGWPGHQAQWRGDPLAESRRRRWRPSTPGAKMSAGPPSSGGG
jgi:uncharacterized membrane protein